MNESTRVEQISPSDYVRVAEFLEKETQGKVKKEQWVNRFGCWWDRNLIQPGSTNGWILVDRYNSVRGFFGYFATPFYLKGEELTALAATSWFVEKDYRKCSSTLLQPFLLNEADCLLYCTTPDEMTTLPILQKLFGFKKIDRNWIKQALVVPHSVGDLVEFLLYKFCRRKLRRFPLLMLKSVSVLISPIWKIWLRLHKYNGNIIFDRIECFEERHQKIWNSVKKQHILIASRSVRASNWAHFELKELRDNRYVLDILTDSNELLGWMVLDKTSVQVDGKKFFYIEMMDLVIDPMKSIDLRALLNGMTEIARQSKEPIIFLKVLELEPTLTRVLGRTGILTTKFRNAYLIKAKHLGENEFEKCWEQGFHPAPIDGDRGFAGLI